MLWSLVAIELMFLHCAEPQLKAKEADWLATVFDVGRIIGML